MKLVSYYMSKYKLCLNNKRCCWAIIGLFLNNSLTYISELVEFYFLIFRAGIARIIFVSTERNMSKPNFEPRYLIKSCQCSAFWAIRTILGHHNFLLLLQYWGKQLAALVLFIQAITKITITWWNCVTPRTFLYIM